MKKGFGIKKEYIKVTQKKVKEKKRISEIKKLFNSHNNKSSTVKAKYQQWIDYAYQNLGRDIIVCLAYESLRYWEYPERIVEKALEIFEGREGYKFLMVVYFDSLEHGIIEYIAKEKGGENWLGIYRKLLKALSIASCYIEILDENEANLLDRDDVQDCLSSLYQRKIDYGLIKEDQGINDFPIFDID